jgi:hypothetical protein
MCAPTHHPCYHAPHHFESQHAISVTKIEHPEIMYDAAYATYDGNTGEPHMGTVTPRLKCQMFREGISIKYCYYFRHN